ncbi:MAG: hypothetical protein ACREQ1_15555 [Woeseiaceae bacterium]
MNESSTKPEGTPTTAFWVTRGAARIALIALHTGALAIVLLELLIPFSSDDHAVERIPILDLPASYAIYGFVACVILVMLGRLLRRIVMRAENLYDGP